MADWRAIPGYDGYWITADGRIAGPGKSGQGRVEMTPMVAERGHRYVLTRRPDVPRKLYVHRAVLLAFVGPPPPGRDWALHWNDVADDNRVENLYWGTLESNAVDRVRNGGQRRGEATASAKLTETQVRELRRRHPAESLRALAREFGVSHTAVRRAIVGRTWNEVRRG